MKEGAHPTASSARGMRRILSTCRQTTALMYLLATSGPTFPTRRALLPPGAACRRRCSVLCTSPRGYGSARSSSPSQHTAAPCVSWQHCRRVDGRRAGGRVRQQRPWRVRHRGDGGRRRLRSFTGGSAQKLRNRSSVVFREPHTSHLTPARRVQLSPMIGALPLRLALSAGCGRATCAVGPVPNQDCCSITSCSRHSRRRWSPPRHP